MPARRACPSLRAYVAAFQVKVVGSPAYFARHPKPRHPRDLLEHECINWHPTADSKPLRWDFTENGRVFSVGVNPRIVSNDPALNLRLARAGVGLTLADHEVVARHSSRELLTVLDEFMTSYPGLSHYYPRRQHVSPALRALIDCVRRNRKGLTGC